MAKRKRRKISDAEFQTMALLYDNEIVQYKKRYYEVMSELEDFLKSIPLDYRQEMIEREHYDKAGYLEIEEILKEVKPKRKLVMFQRFDELDDFDDLDDDLEDWDEVDFDDEEDEDEGLSPAD